MGLNIDQTDFSPADYALFQGKLFQQLEQLKEVMSQPTFGQQPLKIGAELEMYLVNNQGVPSLNNLNLLAKLNDEQFQPELNQYNIELNLTPVDIAGSPFSQIRQEILTKTKHLEDTANQLNTNIVPIGILPTLKQQHLNVDNMTDIARYHCLAKHLYQQRGENFKVNINGDKPLSIDFTDICAEGANTSFQVHLMTKPEQLTQVFNAAQLTLPFVTAVAGNSGIFLGHALWDETRIALFKQSLDIRLHDQHQWQQPTRVNFGHGWLRQSIWEFFAEAVALHPPLIPYCKQHKQDDLPSLQELSMHLGTIWPWHRPVYSPTGNGHIRLEFRAIPAGPTSLDMLANAAFAIGLAMGLHEQVDEMIAYIPFRFAEYNFYRAAQQGLNANILWPSNNKYQPVETQIKSVIASLLPVAKQGLLALGIFEDEADKYLNIIHQRLEQNITGAIWQKSTLKHFERTMSTSKACQRLVSEYLKNSRSCQPVATWERLWK